MPLSDGDAEDRTAGRPLALAVDVGFAVQADVELGAAVQNVGTGDASQCVVAGDLLLDAPGSAVRRLAAVTVPTTEPLEIVLADAGGLEVRVPELVNANLVGSLSAFDAQGQPFRGLGLHGVLEQTWPLPGGTGTLEGLPPGLWTLRAVAPDGRSWERTVTTEAGATLRVSLE